MTISFGPSSWLKLEDGSDDDKLLFPWFIILESADFNIELSFDSMRRGSFEILLSWEKLLLLSFKFYRNTRSVNEK